MSHLFPPLLLHLLYLGLLLVGLLPVAQLLLPNSLQDAGLDLQLLQSRVRHYGAWAGLFLFSSVSAMEAPHLTKILNRSADCCVE